MASSRGLGYVPIRTTVFVLPWGTKGDAYSDDGGSHLRTGA